MLTLRADQSYVLRISVDDDLQAESSKGKEGTQTPQGVGGRGNTMQQFNVWMRIAAQKGRGWKEKQRKLRPMCFIPISLLAFQCFEILSVVGFVLCYFYTCVLRLLPFCLLCCLLLLCRVASSSAVCCTCTKCEHHDFRGWCRQTLGLVLGSSDVVVGVGVRPRLSCEPR